MYSNLRRALIAISCIAISALGFLVALLSLATIKGLTASIILLVWLSAVLALTQMAIAWTRNIRLGRAYSRNALLLGFASLLAPPFEILSKLAETEYAGKILLSAGSVLLFELIIVSPAIALAWHLNQFHAKPKEL